MLLQKLKNNHLLMSGFYKGTSGLSLFFSVPLLINYLGNSDYGLWVLVFALFQWVFSMDFGLASVLKTKVPILIQENEIDLLKSYIRSTYKITSVIALFLFLSFFALLNVIDIKVFLKIPTHSLDFIKNLFLLNIFFFCLNFILNVQKSLFVAFLKGKYAEQSIAVNQILFYISLLIIIWIFPELSFQDKLIVISVSNGLISLLVNGFYTFYFFYLENLNLNTTTITPSKFIKEILLLGSKYMIIQVGLLFVFTSDNYILSNAFGPKEIVPFEVINKLFQFPVMIIFAGLSPLWSMFAKDYIDKNAESLRSIFKKFNYFFIGIVFFISFIAIVCPFVISIWIKEPIIIPKHLVLFIAIVTALRIFISFYSFFLYGIGKIDRYIIILLISIAVKVPLTYYFIQLGYGVKSVVISTIFILIFWLIFIPSQCYSFVNKLKVTK
jgi:O-antigen/teichoic acid export membrane protein